MEPGAFVTYRDQLKAESIDDSDMILAIRKQSLVSYFTCLQVLALIELFDISQEHSKYLRGEVFVCMFARVIDWRGYSVLLKHVGVDGQEDVIRRIGHVNLFHDSVVSPVGYWSLHLQVQPQPCPPPPTLLFWRPIGSALFPSLFSFFFSSLFSLFFCAANLFLLMIVFSSLPLSLSPPLSLSLFILPFPLPLSVGMYGLCTSSLHNPSSSHPDRRLPCILVLPIHMWRRD